MSQSDYIRYKRIAVELQNQSKNLAPVIGSGQYINYKAFTLENTILSTTQTYEKIIPPSSVNVFGIQRNHPEDCSTFTLCSGTNSRVNRKLLLGVYSNAMPLQLASSHVTPNKLSVCNYCR